MTNADSSKQDDDEAGGRPRHIRNDSTFSIDSHGSLTNNNNKNTINIEGMEQIIPQQPQQQAQHETIEGRAARGRSNGTMGQQQSGGEQSSHDSSSLMPGPPPPVHTLPFFNPEDSDDRSDGSLVAFQQYPPVAESPTATSYKWGFSPRQQQQKRTTRRDRFPSFDSVGSSGSVVKRVAGPRTPHGNVAPPAALNVPARPKILPYQERQKLKQQRQKQQQQQQQQSRDPTPPRPGRQVPPPGPMPPPFVMQPNQRMPQQQQHFPQQQQQLQQHPPQHIFAPPPYQQPFPGTPPPFQSYAGPPQPNFPFPPPGMPPYQPPGAPFQPPPPHHHDHRQQQQQQQHGSLYRQPDRPPVRGMQQQRPRPGSGQFAPRPPPTHPPSPQQRTTRGGGSSGENQHQHVIQWQTSSSFDSSDGTDQQQQAQQQQQQSGAPPRPARRKDSLPPPPPPPPPPPAAHIRQDSSGSVSSLGSLDRSGKDEDNKEKEGGFFQRLWSSAPKKHNVHDFHRKNQEFLSKMERKVTMQNSPSPRHIARRVPYTAMSRPPTSRGGHRRLNSIENDDWTEPDEEEDEEEEEEKDPLLTQQQRDTKKEKNKKSKGDSYYGATGKVSDSSSVSYSDTSDDSDRNVHRYDAADERTNLLPPSGISSNEHYDRKYRERGRRGSARQPGLSSSELRTDVTESSRATFRTDNTTNTVSEYQLDQAERARRKRKKKKKRRARRKSRQLQLDDDSESSSVSSNSASSFEYKKWVEKRASKLEKERTKLIEQWKAEAKADAEKARLLERRNRWYRRLWRCFESSYGSFAIKAFQGYTYCEEFIANLPLTIGAIALSTANLGVDWFKFAEENMDSCEPVHFHSKQCTFPEFPGCFYCDTSARMYKVAVNFHFVCSCFAGLLAFGLVAKLFIARQVVFDELSSPTTASPAGLLCMTMDVVFAGRGILGMVVVSAAASVHFCLAIWFMYMALAYHIMPEPSWFPNTTGLGISAVKLWLYHPMAGHFLMAISLSLNFFFFPISLVRVFLNRKISATVAWMQMSAPNISLYTLTIMAQPSFEEEHPDINNFQKVHRMVYLPCMHFLFFLCILGMIASVYGLIARWREFSKVPFGPAHAAFCAPCLSHANAIQAYRASVNSFSTLPARSPYLICLYFYWVIVLIGGTTVTVGIAGKFLASLGKWTHIDLEGEVEPPAPYETAMSLTHMVSTGEIIQQPYVSPAVLQSNETGALYLTRDAAGARRYRRTRKVTAVGFEPMMDAIEMEQERELLLDWVSKHAPRRRHRTLSVPGVDFSYGSFGSGNQGVFGMEEGTNAVLPSRRRSNTLSPQVGRRHSIQS